MMRQVAALTLLLAACGGASEESTTTGLPAPTTTAVPSTTATSEPAATTTEVSEAVVLGYSNDRTTLRMQVGRTYLHDLNVIPVAFQFAEPGWDLLFVGDDLIGMFHSTEDLVAFHVSFFPDTSADEVVTNLSERIATEIPAAAAVAVGGSNAEVFEVGPGFGVAPLDSDRPCTGETVVEERVLDDAVRTFLLPCSMNRLWLVEFDDVTVALHVADVGGTVDEPGDLETVQPLIEQFLAAISFGS